MQWLLDNWFWVVFGGGMVAMHLFGHRRHGSRRAGGEDKNGAPGVEKSNDL